MKTIKVAGVEYPAAYTIYAQSLMSKHFGGINKMVPALQDPDGDRQMEAALFVGWALMSGAAQREIATCQIMGTEYTGKKVPSIDLIRSVLDLDGWREFNRAIGAVISRDSAATVEVAGEPGKNADATQ